MAFNSSGTFTRTGGGGPGGGGDGADLWKGDAAAGIKILAASHDVHDQDIAEGLSLCILRNGAGVPEADIPWGGHKITNLTNPSADQDAATKHYVDNPDQATSPRNMYGTDLSGRLNFTGPSGVNGITWTYADLAWVARGFTAGEANQRLVLAPTVAPDTTGPAAGLTDVFVIDDAGRVNSSAGRLTHNVSYEGAATRTITPGTGTIVRFDTGVFSVSSNDVATITNNYASLTPRAFFTAKNTAGTTEITLEKSASAKLNSIYGDLAGKHRWRMDLGNDVAEGAERVGSNFRLYSYDNAGTTFFAEIDINRLTHLVSFGGAVTASGTITSGSNFDSTSTTCIVSATAGGSIYLRPDGPTVTTSSAKIDTNGNLLIAEGVATAGGGVYAGQGIRGKIKATTSDGYGANFINLNWNGSVLTAYADNSVIGNITYVCDYRIKKDVQPLPSTWEMVKRLNPIRYTQKAYEVWTEDDTPRWGFMAHELQESLFEGAATGVKDGADIQGPNLMVIIAGLTKALQEAMARIEALEAAA